MDLRESEPTCVIFSKVVVDFLVIVYVIIVLQLRARFCYECLFNIAKFIRCLMGDTSLRLIYIH